jgi:hypothetical protein
VICGGIEKKKSRRCCSLFPSQAPAPAEWLTDDGWKKIWVVVVHLAFFFLGQIHLAFFTFLGTQYNNTILHFR